MPLRWKIIETWEEFEEATKHWKQEIACDTETFKLGGALLGVSLSDCGDHTAIYVPFRHYDNGTLTERISGGFKSSLARWFRNKPLLGHNFAYDEQSLLAEGIRTSYVFDTRIGWHLASAPAGPRPYGLKDMQVELLEWARGGDEALELHVKAKGGRLKNGDHYLADLEVLAEYACLDAYATAQGYNKLKPFFKEHDYFWAMEQTMDYQRLLEQNTRLGVSVDVQGLEKAHHRILATKEASLKRLNKELKEVIADLEDSWLDKRLAEYKKDYNRARLLNHPEEWERFNWNSDKHKRELFYDALGQEVVYTTPSGIPSTNADSVKMMRGEWKEAYLKYETNNTLATNFSGPYLASLRSGRLHPGFNICGTVSYRLSGFKPYFLNAPFGETRIMKNLRCDEGWVGVHADLAAIEPTVTAHFSEDETLLKVFGKGLGDIYLDLALEMFPNDHELRLGYNPLEPLSKEVKQHFSRQRAISKVIHLAVSYMGTKYTVSKNLRKEGFDVDIWEADRLVKTYWKRFYKVAEFSARLREYNRKYGYVRNVIGRIIRVPDPEYKDLFNRFIQSSAHDILVRWVLTIYRMCEERGVTIRPMLIDCHDSTSNACPIGQEQTLMRIYEDALERVNQEVGLCVKARAEIKLFKTFAGLKGEEA